MLARTKLKCSFLSDGGKDVISDVMEKFVSPVKETGGKRPRFYKLVCSIFVSFYSIFKRTQYALFVQTIDHFLWSQFL